MENNTQVQGTCMVMCPESEIKMREREGLVHLLEARSGHGHRGGRCNADRRKMVKMFTRSAAGRDLMRPEELRPPPTLRKTINYLLSTVVCDTQTPWPIIYSFVADRLRSVKQDMVIQQPPPVVCVNLLEPIVRFHAYAAYRLCEEPLDVFDPHLNQIHLNESLKQLLVCYDTVDNGGEMSVSRDQMEALYGLLHLGNVDALHRMLLLRPTQNSMLYIALRMSLAEFNNNYVIVCQLLDHLSPLLASVAALHLPHIRRKALSVMNCAYSSKNLCYPIAVLSSMLRYPNETDAAQDCRHYGISLDDDGVHFMKGSFNYSAKESRPRKLSSINDGLSAITLSELLLTASQSYMANNLIV